MDCRDNFESKQNLRKEELLLEVSIHIPRCGYFLAKAEFRTVVRRENSIPAAELCQYNVDEMEISSFFSDKKCC